MTRECKFQHRGIVELFFYDELDAAARSEMTVHLQQCAECTATLEELMMIRHALRAQPDVSAPPAGDWSGFMCRLNESLDPDAETRRQTRGAWRGAAPAWNVVLATAALLTLVTMSVYFAARGPARVIARDSLVSAPPETRVVATSGLRAVGEQHFERAKLVVLGLAAKEPQATSVEDWAYERELASALLTDTRLYRLAAEEKGYTSLAGVMRDLELVLLETSMAEASNKQALGQIQRLIEKRGLIEKMDSVATLGM